MSTKDIARSAVEGGRHARNKHERRHSHRLERRNWNQWRSQYLKDPEKASGRPVKPRPSVGKGFTDKLSPAFRWLDSRVGRKWDEVYAELKSVFDTRRLSSWHIVEQHMVPEVWGAGKESYFRNPESFTFRIDEEGILRGKYNRKRYWANKVRQGPVRMVIDVHKWAGNRRVIDYGAVQFWASAVYSYWETCHYLNVKLCPVPERLHTKAFVGGDYVDFVLSRNSSLIGSEDDKKKFQRTHWAGHSWRQEKRLSKEESRVWSEELTKVQRFKLLIPKQQDIFVKNYPKKKKRSGRSFNREDVVLDLALHP